MKVYETLKVDFVLGVDKDPKKGYFVEVFSGEPERLNREDEKYPNNTLIFYFDNFKDDNTITILDRDFNDEELLELSFYRPNKKFEVIKKMLRDEIDESYKKMLEKFAKDNRKEIIEKCKLISKFCKDPLITDIYIDYDKVFGFPMNKDTFIYLVKDVLHITSGSDLNCKWNIF